MLGRINLPSTLYIWLSNNRLINRSYKNFLHGYQPRTLKVGKSKNKDKTTKIIMIIIIIIIMKRTTRRVTVKD